LCPAPWTPPALEVEQLQALVHRLDSLWSNKSRTVSKRLTLF
jgi:hypothetical protein